MCVRVRWRVLRIFLLCSNSFALREAYNTIRLTLEPLTTNIHVSDIEQVRINGITIRCGIQCFYVKLTIGKRML